MFRVDIDAHVDETEATWEYLDNGACRFKPVTLDPGAATAPATPEILAEEMRKAR